MPRLEFERRKRNMNQNELAAAVLYSKNAISRLEHHRPEPELVGLRLKAALEKYFDMAFETLMEEV